MKSRGFTLIELLVVISIIGLLSSVILAQIKSARDKADVVYTNSTLVQYRSALTQYYHDSGGGSRFPSTATWNTFCLDLQSNCYAVNGSMSSIIADSNVSSSLQNYFSSLPPIMRRPVTIGGAMNSFTYYGPTYGCQDYPECTQIIIRWAVDGAQNCGLNASSLTTLLGTKMCTLTLP